MIGVQHGLDAQAQTPSVDAVIALIGRARVLEKLLAAQKS